MTISGFYGFAYCFVLLFLARENGVETRIDGKTKLLLQNIRNILAQKADVEFQRKECELGSTSCETLSVDLTKDAGRMQKSAKKEVSSAWESGTRPKTMHKSGGRVPSKDEVQAKILKEQQKRSFLNQKKKNFVKQAETLPTLSPLKSFKKEPSDINNVEIQQIKKKKTTTRDGTQKLLEKQTDSQNGKTKPKNENREQCAGKFLKSKTVRTHHNSMAVSNEDEYDDEDEDRWKKTKHEKKSILKSENKIPKMKYSSDEGKKEKAQKAQVFPSVENLFFTMETNDDDVAYASETCRKHKNIYLNQLKEFKIWALMMFDASAKIPSGILQGNVNQYGDFDECLSINAVFKKSKPTEPAGIKGKYCLANVDLTTQTTENAENDRLEKALKKAKSFSVLESTTEDPGHFVPKFTSINWGLCVPDACPAEDVEKLFRRQLSQLNSTGNVLVAVNVAEDNCVVKTDLKLEITKFILGVLGFYAFVVALACYATYLDFKGNPTSPTGSTHTVKNEKESAEIIKSRKPISHLEGNLYRVVMAFSLKRNFKKLWKEETKDAIGCINGIRSICSIMLFLGHKTIPLGWTAFSNRIMLTKTSNQAVTTLLRTSVVYMDSFLLVSGLLISYSLSREIISEGKIRWKMRLLMRYMRLTPALLAVLLFYAYVWDQTGSGPLWNALVKHNAKLCRAYSWKNLLYIQNFFSFEQMCAPHAYQLALNMQLSVLAPLFVHILFHFDKVGFGILQALFTLSSIFRYISTSRNDLSVVVYHGMPVSQLYKTADLFYTRTLHRTSPFVMGAIVGFYLQKFKGRIRIARALVALGWVTALACGFYSIWSPSNVASKDYLYNKTKAAQYAALSPVLWSGFLAWVIVACHLGFGGPLNKFLCNKVFLVFSKISYSFYLTQFLIFFYKVGIKRVPEMFTLAEAVDINGFATVTVVSIILTLFFDSPFAEIKNIIINDDKTMSSADLSHKELAVSTRTKENVEEIEVLVSEEKSSEEEEELETVEQEPEDGTDDSFDFGLDVSADYTESQNADVEEESEDVWDGYERLENLPKDSSESS